MRDSSKSRRNEESEECPSLGVSGALNGFYVMMLCLECISARFNAGPRLGPVLGGRGASFSHSTRNLRLLSNHG